MHITMYGGLPADFNYLSVYNPGGYAPANLAYTGFGAELMSTTGIPLNFTTVVDNYTSNANYTVWTFHIGQDWKWSNGQPVTAQNITTEWSSGFALNPQYDPIGLSSEIVSVQAIGTNTVVFNLNQTDAHLPDRLSRIFDTPLYPEQFIAQGADATGFGTSISNGPFYIANYKSGDQQLVMYRNTYWKPEPKVCEIIWNFVETEADDATYLAAGATDMTFVDPGSAASLTSIPNIHVQVEPGEQVSQLALPITLYPYNMTAFRQALIFGINESALADIGESGYATPAYSAEGGVPSISNIYSSSQKQYTYSPTEALNLLSTIGITKGSDGMLHYSNGTVVTIGFWSDDNIFDDSVIAPMIAANLRSLGFQVNEEETAWNTLTGYGFSNSYGVDNGLILHTANALEPADPYYSAYPAPLTYGLFWEPPTPWMWPANIQAEYQSNLTAITQSANPALNIQYEKNIQNLYAANLPELILLYGDTMIGYSTQRFTGWPSSPGSLLPFQQMFNATAFADLQPVAQSLSTSSASQSLSTSSSAPLPNNTYTIAVAAVVIAIIIIVVAGIVLTRRRGKGSSS